MSLCIILLPCFHLQRQTPSESPWNFSFFTQHCFWELLIGKHLDPVYLFIIIDEEIFCNLSTYLNLFSSPPPFGDNKECYCEHICTHLLVPKQCSQWCISISGIAGWYIPCIDFYLYQLLPNWPPKLLQCALLVMCQRFHFFTLSLIPSIVILLKH